MIENNNNTQAFSIAGKIDTPDYYPAQLSVPKRQIEFFRMSRESYQKSPFLDHRIITHCDEFHLLLFKDIQKINSEIRSHSAHYIFHNAFCSSTLLTRYLDMLSGALVLREPNILYEVATLKRFENTPKATTLQDISWEELYRFVCLMIERRYDDALPTIIKPTDGCNYLMCDLVNSHPQSRGLFIYSTLEHFLVSVLRFKQRHEWVRIRVQELLLDKLHETGSILVNPTTLSVEQSTALVWLLHTEQYIVSTQAENGNCFKSVKAQQLSSKPTDCLQAICDHFLLSYDRDEIRFAAEKTKTGVNAKADNEVYDPDLRRKEYSQAHTTYKREIEQAVKWVSQINPARDLFASLPNPLF